jgi:hypothetical protein
MRRQVEEGQDFCPRMAPTWAINVAPTYQNAKARISPRSISYEKPLKAFFFAYRLNPMTMLAIKRV